MTQPLGSHMSLTSGPIGKSNCVELHVPPQVGNMLNTVMGANPMALAFGGGRDALAKQRARTYYFSFPDLATANAWSEAIENNIKILSKAAPNPGDPSLGRSAVGGLPTGQIDAALQMACEYTL